MGPFPDESVRDEESASPADPCDDRLTVSAGALPWDGTERRGAHDRRQRRVYRFIDRRHGFDRRKRYPALLAMRDRPWILIVVLVFMNLLSLVDGYFTIAEVNLGLAAEGNPILDTVAQHNHWLAIALKIGSVVAVSVIIWMGRRRRIFLELAIVALIVFGGLAAYHWSYLHQMRYL